jgi:hypothetical protein
LNIPAARVVFSPEDRAEILGLIDESLQTGSLTLGATWREMLSADTAAAVRWELTGTIANRATKRGTRTSSGNRA